LPDRFQHRFGILEHVIVPETQYMNPLSLNECIPAAVLFPVGMLATIEFDGESMLVAVKIQEIGAERPLALEFCIRQPPIPQQRPDEFFRIGLFASQFSREIERFPRQRGGLGSAFSRSRSPSDRGGARLKLHHQLPPWSRLRLGMDDDRLDLRWLAGTDVGQRCEPGFVLIAQGQVQDQLGGVF